MSEEREKALEAWVAEQMRLAGHYSPGISFQERDAFNAGWDAAERLHHQTKLHGEEIAGGAGRLAWKARVCDGGSADLLRAFALRAEDADALDAELSVAREALETANGHMATCELTESLGPCDCRLAERRAALAPQSSTVECGEKDPAYPQGMGCALPKGHQTGHANRAGYGWPAKPTVEPAREKTVEQSCLYDVTTCNHPQCQPDAKPTVEPAREPNPAYGCTCSDHLVFSHDVDCGVRESLEPLTKPTAEEKPAGVSPEAHAVTLLTSENDALRSELETAKKEAKRLADGWKEAHREGHTFFSQSCLNLERAEAAEKSLETARRDIERLEGDKWELKTKHDAQHGRALKAERYAEQQVDEALRSLKFLDAANGLLARAAGALGLVDSVSANEAREAIRAHLSLKGTK